VTLSAGSGYGSQENIDPKAKRVTVLYQNMASSNSLTLLLLDIMDFIHNPTPLQMRRRNQRTFTLLRGREWRSKLKELEMVEGETQW
jgi:hypothetical protein